MTFGTVLDTAEFLDCDSNHVYYLIYIGEVVAVKVRWIYRVDMSTVEEYAARQNSNGTRKVSSFHSCHPGYLFGLEDFSINSQERTETQERIERIYGRRGMEYSQGGFHRIPSGKRNAIARPIQYELAIA